MLAAGGIVVRSAEGGTLHVAVVHRPARTDWTFPKGKLEPGETLEACALREVYEETGLRCRLGAMVGSTRYRDRQLRDKVVTYWLMPSFEDEFSPNCEVDELRWVTVDEAGELLTYTCDRALLEQVRRALAELTSGAAPA